MEKVLVHYLSRNPAQAAVVIAILAGILIWDSYRREGK